MAIDPMTIGAGVGLLRGFLGGGAPKTPGYVKRSYELENQIRQAGLDLYRNTDLAATDREAVDAYSRSAMNAAMKMASNYDARAAAMGSPMGKADTRKDRARAQVFGDTAGRIGDMEANLATTRANRQAALLPGASPAALMQGAGALDAADANRYNQEQAGWNAASQLMASVFNQKPASSGRNDRTSGGYDPTHGGLVIPWNPNAGNEPWNVLGMNNTPWSVMGMNAVGRP